MLMPIIGIIRNNKVNNLILTITVIIIIIMIIIIIQKLSFE